MTFIITNRYYIKIAKGEYKPKKNEPKVWFESMESLIQILIGQNQKLLRIIKDSYPLSLTELKKNSLSCHKGIPSRA
jgi:predicted transcriptional regulator